MVREKWWHFVVFPNGACQTGEIYLLKFIEVVG